MFSWHMRGKICKERSCPRDNELMDGFTAYFWQATQKGRPPKAIRWRHDWCLYCICVDKSARKDRAPQTVRRRVGWSRPNGGAVIWSQRLGMTISCSYAWNSHREHIARAQLLNAESWTEEMRRFFQKVFQWAWISMCWQMSSTCAWKMPFTGFNTRSQKGSVAVVQPLPCMYYMYRTLRQTIASHNGSAKHLQDLENPQEQRTSQHCMPGNNGSAV